MSTDWACSQNRQTVAEAVALRGLRRVEQRGAGSAVRRPCLGLRWGLRLPFAGRSPQPGLKLTPPVAAARLIF